MKIIVVGAGQVGEILIKIFVEAFHDVCVIDNNKELVDQITNKYDCNGVIGNGASISVLMKAGVKSSKLLFSGTDSDEVNLLCCHLAKTLGVKHTIARVRGKDYLDQEEELKKVLGIDLLINPERETAQKIASLLSFPYLEKMEPFSKSLSLAEIKLEEETKLEGVLLKDLPSFTKAKILLASVLRKEEVIVPNGLFEIHGGDHLYIIASPQELQKFFKETNLEKKPIKDAFIIGGGIIGYDLANTLVSRGVKTKVIEKDKERCILLNELLPSAEIVYGNGTDTGFLVQQGIKKAHSLVSLAGNDEANLISSIYAASIGVEKIITQITNVDYCRVLNQARNSKTLSPHLLMIDVVLRYVKDISNSTNDIKSLYRIANEKALVIEFKTLEDFKYLNTPLKDIPFKKGALIAGITRNGKAILPKGNDIILPGDLVICVTTDLKVISLSDIIAED